ncbi:MAG: hypothetical protein CMH98_22205 [Oceanospirillaceae bacterium]|nr:hypothetical protein [Oceanospirillaceae bacterium]
MKDLEGVRDLYGGRGREGLGRTKIERRELGWGEEMGCKMEGAGWKPVPWSCRAGRELDEGS